MPTSVRPTTPGGVVMHVVCRSLIAGLASAGWLSMASPALAQTAAPVVPSVTAAASATGLAGLYEHTLAGKLSPVLADHLPRVYVPNRGSNDVSVIDPRTMKVVDRFSVGRSPQHVVPSWDLRTLWVNNNGHRSKGGSLTPIDPRSGKPGPAVKVDDPYNMYFTLDGRYAIIVAEALRRLDFRDPQTMRLRFSIQTPECHGINHGDFSVDGTIAVFTCEFSGRLARVDLAARKVVAMLELRADAMPQDIRLSPDGKTYYVADMRSDGVHLIDAETFKVRGFVPTGIGAHGLYPSRDARWLYVANRGTQEMARKAPPDSPGSVTVLDFATAAVVSHWPVPGGGSPDMGNVSADGTQLWLSGRFDDEVYVFDTTSGAVTKIAVGDEPHGLTVWPQPGRLSLGHTGNMR